MSSVARFYGKIEAPLSMDEERELLAEAQSGSQNAVVYFNL
jgi:hypothetical protein